MDQETGGRKERRHKKEVELENERSQEMRALWRGTELRMPLGGQVAQSKRLRQETKDREGKGSQQRGPWATGGRKGPWKTAREKSRRDRENKQQDEEGEIAPGVGAQEKKDMTITGGEARKVRGPGKGNGSKGARRGRAKPGGSQGGSCWRG